MTPDVIVVPAIVGLPCIVICVRMWLRHKEKMATLAAGSASPADESRLARIEQAVDAIAVEVERLGEGQRFVTKLLAERGSAPAPLPASGGATEMRVTTPH
jgi:anti-sigma factor RsiW